MVKVHARNIFVNQYRDQDMEDHKRRKGIINYTYIIFNVIWTDESLIKTNHR